MATHASILVWEIPGTEEPGGWRWGVGLQSIGLQWVRHDWACKHSHFIDGETEETEVSGPRHTARKCCKPARVGALLHGSSVRLLPLLSVHPWLGLRESSGHSAAYLSCGNCLVPGGHEAPREWNIHSPDGESRGAHLPCTVTHRAFSLSGSECVSSLAGQEGWALETAGISKF